MDGGVVGIGRDLAAGVVGFGHEQAPAGHEPHSDVGAHPHRHGDGCSHDGPSVGRQVLPRARRERPPGGRRLVRPALHPTSGAHTRVHRHRSQGSGARGAPDQRWPGVPDPCARWPGAGKGAEHHDAPAACGSADLPRSRGPEERGAGSRDRRRLVPHLLRAEARRALRALAARGLRTADGAPHPRRFRDPRHGHGCDQRRRRGRLRRAAADAGAVRRRHGCARDELPRRRLSPPRPRTGGRHHPGFVPQRQAG